jgi:hypothetical protein
MMAPVAAGFIRSLHVHGAKHTGITMTRDQASKFEFAWICEAPDYLVRFLRGPGRPNRQFLELWKMPAGFEAVSRANPWLFAGSGIGTKYLSIGRHCVGA